ncbi:MAG TPA: molybdopterin-guanine dinucleotide biosynthesis protein B [Candidatus Cloacimonetes bacterium]|nr:molybdopterin-guanine dinucleotide biosynthesis protein B [Candidatus Cloacimonadota bacterium]
MKVFSVAGYHHTGKTTLVVNLLKELKRRGYKVASVKDIHYEDFTMEKPGSNSQKHLQASENVVFARGFKETYQIWNRQLSLNEMLAHLSADYVIVEGMKTAALPRIICANDRDQLAELVDGTVFAVSGKFSDEHKKYDHLPVLHAERNIRDLADIIEQKVFEVLPLAKPECCSACGFSCYGMVAEILKGNKTRNDCRTDRKIGIHLNVDGKEIKIVPYVQNSFKDSVLGFVRNLKGCERGKVEIEIDG